MTETELKTLLSGITPPDEAARAAAHAHWAGLAKPLGGLGALETLLEDAAALTGSAALDVSRRAVLVLCSDNGVVAQGVSQTDQSVTRAVAENLAASSSGMATLAVPIHDAEEAFNPNAVKVVMDAKGYALYFSRATIPWDRDRFAQSRETIGDSLLRHIGIYGYRAGFIRRYVSWAPSPLEQIEMLEQLRVLWYGEKIHVAVAAEVPGTGVDTPEDLERVRAELR